MKKVCMLAVMHSAKDDRIFFKESLSLKKHGFEVVFIHRVNEAGEIKDMSGKVLNSDGEREISIEGIRHIGIIEPNGLIQKLLKKIFLGSFYRSFINAAVNEKADVYHAHEPQSYYLALKIGRKTGARVVFDAHESWLTGPLKDKYIRWRYLAKMKFLIAANSITRDRLVSKYPQIESTVIYNASVIPSIEYKPVTEIVIAHEGAFPFNRGLTLFLEAMRLLRENTGDFRVKIIGSFKAQEKQYFDRFCSDNYEEEFIFVTGWKPYEELPKTLEGSSIGLILNTPTPNNLYGGPANKLFNYIANNMCVVAVDLPETTRIIKKYNCGFTLPDRNPQSLCDVLLNLISNPDLLEGKRQASHHAHKSLRWDEEAKKLIQFYSETVLKGK